MAALAKGKYSLCHHVEVPARVPRNLENAKKFIDFALTADVQSRSAEVKSYQVPSNKNAISAPEAPDVSSIKLIDYNHALYGSKVERTRLLKKWDTDVKVLPR